VKSIVWIIVTKSELSPKYNPASQAKMPFAKVYYWCTGDFSTGSGWRRVVP